MAWWLANRSSKLLRSPNVWRSGDELKNTKRSWQRACKSFDCVWQDTSKDFFIVCKLLPGKPQSPLWAAEQLSEHLSFTVCIHHIVWSGGVSRGGARSLFFLFFFAVRRLSGERRKEKNKRPSDGLISCLVVCFLVCFCLLLLSACTMDTCKEECHTSAAEEADRIAAGIRPAQPDWVIPALLHWTL